MEEMVADGATFLSSPCHGYGVSHPPTIKKTPHCLNPFTEPREVGGGKFFFLGNRVGNCFPSFLPPWARWTLKKGLMVPSPPPFYYGGDRWLFF